MILKNEDTYKQYMYSYPHKTAYRNFLTPIHISSLKNQIMSSDIGLYAHIPFCSTKCGYCNLFSIAGNSNDSLMDSYIDACIEHAEILYKYVEPKIDSFTVGGGTPLILSEKNLNKLFSIPNEIFKTNMSEIFSCVETSPNETTPEKLEILKQNSVNRISIGVQSFLDTELESLRRFHTVKYCRDAIKNIKKLDFDTLNIDIIYGTPGQTKETLQYSLSEAMSYEPEEIFIYPLYRRQRDVIVGKSENMAELYEHGRDFLKNNGYVQKSMRQFTKRRVKTITCGFENSLAIGAGGRTYIGTMHSCTPFSENPNNIKKEIINYINDDHRELFKHGFMLDEDEQKRRFIIKNLLTVSGMDISDYRKYFKSEPLSDFPIFFELIKDDFVTIIGNHITLTQEGLELSDRIGPAFISKNVHKLMNEWEDGK